MEEVLVLVHTLVLRARLFVLVHQAFAKLSAAAGDVAHQVETLSA